MGCGSARRRPLAELVAAPALAIVGSRHPTTAGERFARQVAADVAAAGVCVVSGLALGIDAAAHAGALDAGGRTAAVLGCGIDRLYPRRNAALGERVAASGAVVSEWGPGVLPAPWRFPARNRLIAALACATLVIEAGGRSGALITADWALALGRDVLAVPGAVWMALGEGTNRLLRAGAQPVTCAEDALDALGLSPVPPRTPAPPLEGLPGAVWAALRARPMRREEVALAIGGAAGVLGAALTELELGGLLAEEPDGTLVALGPSNGGARTSGAPNGGR